MQLQGVIKKQTKKAYKLVPLCVYSEKNASCLEKTLYRCILSLSLVCIFEIYVKIFSMYIYSRHETKKNIPNISSKSNHFIAA
jgi:hypothetical protein